MELEQTQSDATNTEISSESQTASTDDSSSQAGSGQQAAKQDSTPFNEHPRFKELIEEKNRYAEQTKAFERQLKELQTRLESVSKPQQAQADSPMVQKLKAAGVDEDFVKWVAQQEKLMGDFQNISQWRQQTEAQTQQQKAETAFEKLCVEHKITNDALKDRYLAAVRHAAAKDPSLQVEDLPKVFKTIHDAETKFQEELRRAAIADYTKGKTKDQVPPGAKPGQSAAKSSTKPGPKQETITDPEQLRAQFAKRVLELARANRNS